MKSIPTQIGDVLILSTAAFVAAYAVGRVLRRGQRDFAAHTHAKVERESAAALALAKTLVVPGRRIFVRNVDTDEWSEVVN